ncbi:YeeE/YedE family protein [Alicyclobacillus tolerans]|uniref:YeeE/YedE family protein n=1 Tax=Alicyclobacillus tolerans TaxID=90970 RepID=UPI001F2445CF|nr:YeeE/YedE family protein [Alicyclobacillus tolerans]MCF8564120.1 YeeE/YedE family protein [Alicyclobacillus tolerans]
MAVTEGQILNLDGPAAPFAETRSTQSPGHIVFAIIVFIVGAIALAQAVSWRQAALFLVAGVLGVTLYHARYGFTTGYRRFIVERRGAALRANMVMFLMANILFLPFLLKGSALGHSVSGYVSPIGISLVFGSFAFGLGMQLADGCASGTLYHTGGGDIRGILTIVGFVIGSLLGSLNFPWWTGLPHFAPVSFLKTFGPVGGFGVELLLLAAVWVGTFLWERRHNGDVEPMVNIHQRGGLTSVFRGPWSWIAGGVVLAVGNTLVLILSGKPWGVTFAFALWGAKISQAVGIPVAHWGYWQTAANATALHQSILHDVTTVTDLGVMLGALLAAGLAGRFPKKYFRGIPARMAIAVTLGGVLMGYGARLAFGCNIGSYFSGIASFSLHGWVWFLCAMAGSAIGVKLRPACGLGNIGKK